MTWFWTAILIYVVATWICSALFLLMKCEDAQEDTENLLADVKRDRPIRYRFCLTGAVLLLGPFLPLIIAFCVPAVWREHRKWKKLARTHREALMEPIHAVNLPDGARDFFDEMTPRFEDLGFTLQGDYFNKPQPLPVYVRCLTSPRGETVADLSYIGDETAFSFNSVLENGTVRETACSESPLPEESLQDINASGRYHAAMFDRTTSDASPHSLYQRHLQSLADLEQHHHCGTLHIPADQIPVLIKYANSTFGQVLYDQGELDEPPSATPCPSGAV